ncbi:MAG: DUF2339 domain-containing protein [Acidobacteria bacterium]|nr:DUF2339 domain-containing protein [Acidobacteriota bacterium]
MANRFRCHRRSAGGTLVAMGSEESFSQPQSHTDEAGVAAELKQLAARVSQLERELAAMRAGGRFPAPLPPPPPPPAALPVIQHSEVEEAAIADSVVSASGKGSLESRLGAQVFNRIGIVALLFAATLGLKLAIDNQWIGPVGRILIGLIAGTGVVVWSERFRRKGFSAFSYSLKAVGTGVLYLSLWAAFQLYHLLPSSAALVGMILVTAWNAYMAWSQDAELLAAYALIGGLATPLLLSTGGDHEVFLFTYLLAIDVATVLLVRVKPWARLLFGAFPATAAYFIGWYWEFYHEPAFAVTTAFVGLFFVVFASASLGGAVPREKEAEKPARRGGLHVRDILLPLANAAFISLALYSVMQDSDRHWFLPWLMLILAATYLLITRLPQGAVAAAVHLSLAVVFLTIAVPLKASGHWITVAWLVEGVALLWVALRVGAGRVGRDAPHSNASDVLRWLSAGSLVLGLGGVIAVPFWFDGGLTAPLLNRNLATALIGVAAFAGAAWMALHARAGGGELKAVWSRFSFAALLAVDALAVLLALREISTSRYGSAQHVSFANADFGMALVGLAVLGGVAWAALRIAVVDVAALVWAQLSGGSVIAINLIAVLAGVREVATLWQVSTTDPDMELRRALAVSGFLMLYGAALLAVGFWRRSAFVRWQALALLVFSIGKTFLYDMRNLSQGYRFASFLALGALLMTISFAYQKDWLSLRDTLKDETSAASANPSKGERGQ